MLLLFAHIAMHSPMVSMLQLNKMQAHYYGISTEISYKTTIEEETNKDTAGYYIHVPR